MLIIWLFEQIIFIFQLLPNYSDGERMRWKVMMILLIPHKTCMRTHSNDNIPIHSFQWHNKIYVKPIYMFCIHIIIIYNKNARIEMIFQLWFSCNSIKADFKLDISLAVIWEIRRWTYFSERSYSLPSFSLVFISWCNRLQNIDRTANRTFYHTTTTFNIYPFQLNNQLRKTPQW